MKDLAVTISQDAWDEANRLLFTDDGCENAGVFLCGLADTDTNHRLLARQFIPVPAHLYLERLGYHLEVAPSFYNDIVTRCQRDGLHPIIIHSHPGHQAAWYSQSDDHGESQLLTVLQDLLPGTLVGSIVVTPIAVTGRRLTASGFVPLARIRVVGLRIRNTDPSKAGSQSDEVQPEERFDRQVRIFGAANQQLISSLHVGIVGFGGTGSIVAEQVVRVGVGTVTLVDNDIIEASNLSRVVGATASDIGRHKVDVGQRSLCKSGNAVVVGIDDSALKQDVLLQLRDCDVVFSCVDNDRSRATLNRFAYQYLIPVIDIGVRLDARSGDVKASGGRVSIVGAGAVCLRCSHHLDSERIRAESLSPHERISLANEGYAMGVGEPVPSVISLNTVVAGLGATAFINIFTNLTGGVQPADQIYDGASGAVFPVSQVHSAACDVCDPALGVRGLGDKQIVSAY